jgi:uncharacterized NAD(P)/FAD-binding protein YdhS
MLHHFFRPIPISTHKKETTTPDKQTQQRYYICYPKNKNMQTFLIVLLVCCLSIAVCPLAAQPFTPNPRRVAEMTHPTLNFESMQHQSIGIA